MYLRIVDTYYTTENEGYRETMPVVHLFGRDTQYRRHHVRVDGFRPYFLVTQSEWAEHGTDVSSDERVVSVETEDIRGRPEDAISGEPLVRVCCREPSDVGELRELFDDPYEADVLYPIRFLVDMESYQWIEVPDDVSHRDDPVDVGYITIDPRGCPDETPPLRVVTYDIEVRQGGSGPPVVSEEGTEQARNPITAIAAHDSYTDEYRVWLCKHDSWGVTESRTAREAVDCDVGVYANPRDVAGLFCEWVTERDFDALIGWNASTFDHPYLVNYCLTNDVGAVYGLSPTNDVYPMSGDGSWINGNLKGRLLLDLLVMYKKCKVHELSSYKLEDVAKEEGVSVGKLSIENEIDVPHDVPSIDYAWENHPSVFCRYSLRDVKATVGINRESQKDVSIL